MKRMVSCPFAIASCVFCLGCTWTRFDDVMDNPPVERLESPSSTTALGLSVASYEGALGTQLVASASDRIVLYDLGTGSDPTRTATSTQTCVGDNGCVLAHQLGAVKSSALTGGKGCVAYGMGTVLEVSGVASGKLWLYCEDATRRSLDLPPTLQTWLMNRALTAQLQLTIATPRDKATPALAAALSDASLSWYYSGTSAAPVELPSLPDNKTVGRAIAVMPHDTSSTIAVSSLTTNEVFLYEVDAAGVATLTGCITGPAQFGRLLTTGKFSNDSMASLLVADATNIYAVAGPSLVLPPASTTPTCVDISTIQVLAKAACASTLNLSACDSSSFGSSMAAANLNGTGLDELIVGVPDAVARGEGAAGAVLTYSLTAGAFVIADGLYVSSATSGDRLGTSVGAAPAGALDRIVVGVPGDNSVMEFFCNSLVPAESKTGRCP